MPGWETPLAFSLVSAQKIIQQQSQFKTTILNYVGEPGRIRQFPLSNFLNDFWQIVENAL